VTDVGGIERGADGRNGLRLRHVLRGREHGSTAERMADQQLRRLILFAQMISRNDDVAQVRGEIGVGKLTLGSAEPGEVEAQYGKAPLGKRLTDPRGGKDILGTGEAVREQGERARPSLGPIEPCGKPCAARVGKGDPFALTSHALPLRSARRLHRPRIGAINVVV
jgi:hypothetical protein